MPKSPRAFRMGFVHLALMFYTLVAIAPVAIVVMNSFKTRRGSSTSR